MEDRSNSAQLWKWFTPPFPSLVAPLQTYPLLTLSFLPFPLSLSFPPSDCESISGSLKTCQMCSDQCNGLRVHYIHSAPFYEVTSWRGLPAGALCRTVNQAWQRWGGREREGEGGERGRRKGGDGWIMGGWKSALPPLCLVSQEEILRRWKHTPARWHSHTLSHTHRAYSKIPTACAYHRVHTVDTHACFIWACTNLRVSKWGPGTCRSAVGLIKMRIQFNVYSLIWRQYKNNEYSIMQFNCRYFIWLQTETKTKSSVITLNEPL